MVVFICCSGGGTSSMFCVHLKRAMTDAKVIYEYVPDIVKDYEKLTAEYDYILAYGGLHMITEQTAAEFDKYCDLILVCPQVHHHFASHEAIMAAYDTPIKKLDPKVFGTMNGAKVYSDIKYFQKTGEWIG
ncbi:hypothetical protein [Culicoidibacter larvae]|uniref:PTS EIIB type-3 domain-containing protein n=1 Tax=Culicoidibacter larvae TaxID=2579976 RepID=A0A5R8Q9I6_9FIRM|nr:hypothetical protein [Culicoidibacter larvae]TLG72097.1 hypothetical protein FEZ08_09700 [Culicoidibacter larvae]